ncbi:MAG: 50S ribosomal protein L29 [Chitinophagales bacterium]|nr:50S ribosomal protein L29 [Chitinophagales bacterium]
MAKSNKSKVEEFRSMDDQTLAERIEQDTVALSKMKFGHAVNPIENPLSIRDLRRDIARMKTELHKRALG